MTNDQFKVIAGIDTHADTHHVALITDYGKKLGDRKFLAVGSGYQEIAAYLTSHGPVTAVGVEGTGSYGAELARVLAGHGFTVREVNRANRAERRLHGNPQPRQYEAQLHQGGDSASRFNSFVSEEWPSTVRGLPAGMSRVPNRRAGRQRPERCIRLWTFRADDF